MAAFSPTTEAALLAELSKAVRSAGNQGLTSAADLRGFLALLVGELVGRTSNPLGVLTAPNGLRYRLVVANDGTLSTVPAEGAQDADAAAFIAAAGLQDPAQQAAVDQLVRALKVGNIWPRLRACYPMVGGTARAHARNLKDPRDADEAFRLSFLNDPLHTERGVAWNGVDQYADTHFVAADHLALNNNHLAYYATAEASSGSSNDIEIEMGTTSNGSYFCLLLHYGSGVAYDTTRYSHYSAGPDSGLGFAIGSKETANLSSLYRDGQPLAIDRSGPQPDSYPAASLLLARRQEGYFSHKTCGFASVGDSLTPAQAQAYAAAVATFQQALGRATTSAG